MDAASTLNLMRMGVLFVMLVVCAYTDIKDGKLYNWCTLPGIFVGLVSAFLEGHLREQVYMSHLFVSHLGGFLIGFGLFFLLFLSGGFGAGDMKLAGAIGSLGGWFFVLNALIYGSLVGAMMALGVLIWHGKFFAGLGDSIKLLFTFNKKRYAEEKKAEKEALITIPYGLAISLGSFWAWFMVMLKNL